MAGVACTSRDVGQLSCQNTRLSHSSNKHSKVIDEYFFLLQSIDIQITVLRYNLRYLLFLLVLDSGGSVGDVSVCVRMYVSFHM